MNFDFEKMTAPTRELSQLAIKSYEDLAEIQIKNILEANRMGIESLKSVASINNADDWKNYLAEQTAQGKTVAENFAADMKTASEIGQNYINEAKKVVESSFKA